MLNKRLLELREKVGLSQRELSERLKMARTTYSGYENGTREPDNETLKRIAEYFNVSTDYLLGIEEVKKADPVERLIELMDVLKLTDDEIVRRMPFSIGGERLSPDEARQFVAFVRSQREIRKLAPAAKSDPSKP